MRSSDFLIAELLYRNVCQGSVGMYSGEGATLVHVNAKALKPSEGRRACIMVNGFLFKENVKCMPVNAGNTDDHSYHHAFMHANTHAHKCIKTPVSFSVFLFTPPSLIHTLLQ